MQRQNRKSRALAFGLFLLVILCAMMPQTAFAAETDGLRLYPGGMPFGVRVEMRGVPIVGLSDVVGAQGTHAPARDAGIAVGDILLAINGQATEHADDVTRAVAASNGQPLMLTIERGETTRDIAVTPTADKDGNYRLGMHVKDGAAGIGTVSFIFPNTGAFAGLGHGICDVDTGALLPITRGVVTDVDIVGVHRGKSGHPGELRGVFLGGKTGTLIANAHTGVYGVFGTLPTNIPTEPLAVLAADEICEGAAKIYCTVGEKTEQYEIKLSKINPHTETKNFVVEVTDERLLSITGGIVQGMSGSPIVQDGKLVGAVTHVLINDPTRGYGITVANMLRNMPCAIR